MVINNFAGYTRLFQPDKPVTKGQAAIALTTGEAAEVVSEELARIEADSIADKAVAAHNALVAEVEKDINASFEKELMLEKEKIDAVQKMAEEAMQEVERLRVATGEMMSPSESFNLGMHGMQYNPSAFYSIPQQHVPQGQQNMQLPSYHQSQGNLHHKPNSQNPSEFMPNDHLGRLQGLDLGSRGSHLVKSEGATMSASESSSTL